MSRLVLTSRILSFLTHSLSFSLLNVCVILVSHITVQAIIFFPHSTTHAWYQLDSVVCFPLFSSKEHTLYSPGSGSSRSLSISFTIFLLTLSSYLCSTSFLCPPVSQIFSLSNIHLLSLFFSLFIYPFRLLSMIPSLSFSLSLTMILPSRFHYLYYLPLSLLPCTIPLRRPYSRLAVTPYTQVICLALTCYFYHCSSSFHRLSLSILQRNATTTHLCSFSFPSNHRVLGLPDNFRFSAQWLSTATAQPALRTRILTSDSGHETCELYTVK